MTAIGALMESRGLSVRYHGALRAALDDVSMSVSPGELVAIAGPNGSGKTTLLRALLGLVRPERGDAWIGGRPAAEWDRAALARTVGVVTQREETVFPLRVHDTVMLGRYAHLGPLASPRAADRAAVAAALARCDVAGFAERGVDELSGGEWQRVRVARALAQEPKALVLDEPTASLDVRHEMELFELIHGLVRGGLAGLVVTHQLNLAARFADRIVLLDEGRVVAQGAPHAVLERDVVARVFRWPVAVTTWCDGSPQVVPLRTGESSLPPSPPFTSGSTDR